MKIKVNIDINTKKIMAARGLGSSNKVQKYLASEVVRLSDPYVPMQQGMLKGSHQIAQDGSQIVYPGPYAHYQWYGEAMAGRAPKHYSGKSLSYSGGGMRGKRWTERMVIDKRKEIENNVETFIKRG